MDPVALYVMAIAAGAVVFFVGEWLRLEAVAVLIIVALVVVPVRPDGGGVLDAATALAGLGSSAVVTVGGMFVLAAALTRTGALLGIVRRLRGLNLGEGGLTLATMLLVALLSAFVNNTAVVAMFIPVTIDLARSAGFAPSRLLMPVSFGAILGGTCTLIGTSTNLIVNDLGTGHGIAPMGMFEFSRMGVLLVATGVAVVVLWSRRFLPERDTVTGTLPAGAALEYVTEIELRDGCVLAGKPLSEALGKHGDAIDVMQLIRGELITWRPGPDRVLKHGDLLVVRAPPGPLLALRRAPGVVLLPDPQVEGEPGRGETLAELIVAPGSRWLGATLADVRMWQTDRLRVLAVQRHGAHLREGIQNLPLMLGDVLLVQGTPEAVTAITRSPDFLLIEAVDARVVRAHRARRALAITAVTVGLIAFRPLQAPVFALGGALAFVLSNCLTAREAWRAVEMPILMLIAGALALGQAMDESGAATWLATTALGPLDSVGAPHTRAWIALSALYLLTMVLTEAMTNNAAAALLTPIALSLADSLGADGRPFLFAIAFAASASFVTPIGYQTNTLVYSTGGYTFGDFARTGVWVSVACWITASIALPLIWPLFPA